MGSVNHGFVVCDFLNQDSPAGFPKKDIGIFSYNATTKTYARVEVFMESKPFAQDVSVDGNTWITSAEIPYKGKTVLYRDVYLFQSDREGTTTTQISADSGKTWTTVTKFTAERTR